MNSRFAIISLLFISGIISPVYAQSISLFDDCNPLIKAIRPYLFIVRAEYALEDEEGNIFGQNGHEYYGFKYGPGVNIGGDLWVSASTVQSYLSDTSYLAYGENYHPVSTSLFYKGLDEKELTSMPEGLNAGNPMRFQSFHDHGLRAAETMPDSSSCVVITFQKIGSKPPGQSIYRLSYLNTAVQWQGSQGKLANTVLGESDFAVLFIEKTEPGRVDYLFGGFVEKIDEQWTAIRFDKKEDKVPAPGELTPVKKQKNKRNQKK